MTTCFSISPFHLLSSQIASLYQRPHPENTPFWGEYTLFTLDIWLWCVSKLSPLEKIVQPVATLLDPIFMRQWALTSITASQTPQKRVSSPVVPQHLWHVLSWLFQSQPTAHSFKPPHTMTTEPSSLNSIRTRFFSLLLLLGILNGIVIMKTYQDTFN